MVIPGTRIEILDKLQIPSKWGIITMCSGHVFTYFLDFSLPSWLLSMTIEVPRTGGSYSRRSRGYIPPRRERSS